jgi:DNA polymerase-3 subunit beta
MKLTCLRDDLARGLSIVGGAVPSKATLPVLQNVHLSTVDGWLQLAATDLEVGITCRVSAKVEEEGATTVPAKLLSQFVSSLPSEQVSMALSERIMTMALQCGGFDAKIRGIAATEFPVFADADGGQTITLDVQLFRGMIEQVVYACEKGIARPVLSGVYLDLRTDGLTLAACDGYRMGVCRTALSSEFSATAILPSDAMRELVRVSKGMSGELTIVFVTGNRVLFRLGDIEIGVQTIDGQYPDYEMLIPKAHTTRAVVDTAALAGIVRAVGLFRGDRKYISLQVDPTEQRLIVSAESSEAGANTCVLPASVEGEAVFLNLNIWYLPEALAALPTAELSISANGDKEAVLIEPVGGSARHMLMPMHVAK